MSGRYGPYVKFGKVNATLPKDTDPQALTMDEAVALIAARSGKEPKMKKKAAPKKETAKKPAGKKTAAKKAPAKKAAKKPKAA
jgi:DNA topoisomerase-1